MLYGLCFNVFVTIFNKQGFLSPYLLDFKASLENLHVSEDTWYVEMFSKYLNAVAQINPNTKKTRVEYVCSLSKEEHEFC